MPSEVIITRTARIWLRDDGILQSVNLPNARETLEDAQANVAAEARLSPTPRWLMLADIRAMQSIDRAARAYYSSVQSSVVALALLVESPVSQVIANFFMGLNKVPVPTRLFTSEAEAVTWLGKFIE